MKSLRQQFMGICTRRLDLAQEQKGPKEVCTRSAMADALSYRSGGNSGRYRIRSNRAEIDENLFGNRAKK
jgi:hypothetical protein